MNQDHLQQQPAVDDYVIGGPSDFAEDVSPAAKGWKADLDSDGNTKRDEIGMPQYRSDTFNNPERAPGVSPSRQASLAEVHAKAKVATRIARLMLPRTASEDVIEDQALSLMDLPISNLNNTLTRLAQEQDDEDEDEEDEDEGQSKQAADDEDDDADDDEDDDDAGQSKQAKGLPPEFLENIKKKKKDDDAKDKDEGKKEARRRLRAQQQQGDESDDDEDDEQQSKQARRRLKAQQQQDSDDEDEGQQSKQARTRKAQQQQQDDEEGEEQVGKQAYSLIKQAAAALLQLPVSARATAFRVALPGLAKAASEQLGPLAQDQVQSQVQQLVQNAMQQLQQQQVAQDQAPQQQVAQGQMPQQQQPVAQGFGQDTLADDALVDQMLQDPGDMSEDSIQMDPPDMDLGLGGGEDPALQQIFASDTEVQRALEAQTLQSGHTASSRTASTRTVGTRPTAGVSQLGGGTSGAPSTGVEEINRLAGMWSSAPDVSSVFRS